MSEAEQKARKGLVFSDKFQVLVLAVVFVIPIVAAMLYRPSGTMNYGELVEPARPLQAVTLRDLEGRTVSLDALKGKWTFFYFGAPECRRPCQDNLYKMRQVRLAQGKNAHRVQYVWLLTAPAAAADLAALRRAHPDLRILQAAPAELRALARQFRLPAGDPLQRLERIYLIDPLGNLMMSYPLGADPSGMRKDLARLLRVSRIG